MSWPPLELRLTHQDLTLRGVSDEDALGLAEVLDGGVLAPDQYQFLGDLLTDRPTAELGARKMLEYHWGTRASLAPTDWKLPLCAVLGGVVIGSQSGEAKDFGIRREVSTGSYLGLAHQGRGIGTRMRAMALELFFGLGAETCTSGYALGNEASRRVSEKLGYQLDGIERPVVNGRVRPTQKVRVSQDMWLRSRPRWLDDLDMVGLAEVAPLLGAQRGQ